MSKALAINPDIGLREILEVSQDNSYDLVYSPVLQGPGNSVGGTFIKPSAIHAGASTTYDNPDALPGDASVSQLKRFKEDFESQMGTGQEGMCVFQTNDGETKLIPYRNGLAAEYANNGNIVDGTEGISLDRAVEAYVQESGNTLQFPSVY